MTGSINDLGQFSSSSSTISLAGALILPENGQMQSFSITRNYNLIVF